MVNDGVKKPVFDELVKKVNAIDTKILSTSGLASNIKYDWNKALRIRLRMLTKR